MLNTLNTCSTFDILNIIHIFNISSEPFSAAFTNISTSPPWLAAFRRTAKSSAFALFSIHFQELPGQRVRANIIAYSSGWDSWNLRGMNVSGCSE